MKIFLAIFAAVLAQTMIVGVEIAAHISVEFLPRVMIAVPLTLIIEYPMLVLYAGVRK